MPEAHRSDTGDRRLQASEDPSPPEPARRAHSEIVVAATPHEVFEFLGDGSRYAEWVVGATEIEAEDDAFPAKGASITPRVGVDPVSNDGTTEVTDVEADRRLALLAHVEPFGRARISFDLRRAPGGTLVTMEEEAVGEGVRVEAAHRATRAIRARNGETLWRLKLLVERDLPASDRPGSSTHPAARVPDLAGNAVARVFAWASGLRNDRVFHPKGTAFAARARLESDAVGLLSDRPEVEAIVRVSRGIGLPHPLPDFNGVAVRLLDAHGPGLDQDLLLVSALSPPVARHVLVPMPVLPWSGYSSILPYRTPGGLRMFAVGPIAATTIGRLSADLPAPLELMAAPLLGPWERVARLELTSVLDGPSSDALRFDPWHTGPELLPAGFLNRLRLPAYAASQAARRP